MSEIKRVKIDSILESQIPEFLNEDSPLFLEFLKQYYRSLEHQGGTLDIVNNLKKYKDIEAFNKESLKPSTTLTSKVLAFDSTINVVSTVGWPDTYGLLKVDDEIITYLSKTPTSFVDCMRGFSGIDKIESVENPEYLSFSTTSASEHSNNSTIQNLSNLFLTQFFQKFRNEFFPGFENREFLDGLELPNILTSAKNFYSSKGTDSSYKLLFKILYNTDIEIVKPQDYTLVPSSNVYFVTKNILVEKIGGTGDPLYLPGNFLFQTLPGIGTVSASIFNVEYRPVDKKELYEISLDSTSLSGTFQVSGTTKISEDVAVGSDTILVDSTIGFAQQGSIIIRTKTSDLVTINYTDKTTNQFFGVTGVDRILPFGTELVEQKFAVSVLESESDPINFRVINVIDTIDSSKTSNMRVGDKVRLSGFGKDLSSKVEFNNWIYNIPTYHNTRTVVKVSNTLYRIKLYDAVYFYLNENIILFDENGNTLPGSINSIEYSNPTIKKYADSILVQVNSTAGYEVTNTIGIRRKINKAKHNTNYFPNLSKIPTGVQNTYLDAAATSMFVTSTGIPNYTISATDNKSTVTTSGAGTTDVFYSPNHPYVTGESIYYQPYGNSGINTGAYQFTKISNDTFKLSYSKADIFSKTYITANSGITSDKIVKFGYENKTIKNQKLVKEVNLVPTPLVIADNENRRVSTGDNKQLALLSNGVELYSPTIFDETIHYGKLTSIEVLSSGSGYDVLSPPNLVVQDTSGSGVKAKLNITGNVKQVNIISAGVGYQTKPKITISGGNGSDCVLESNLVSAKIVAKFKGNSSVSVGNDTITFDEQLLFDDNEEVVYNNNGNVSIGGLTNGAIYYVGIHTTNVIKLYTTIQNSSAKINPINLTSVSNGTNDFTTVTNKNTISKIYVKNPGKGYSNRSIRVPSILSSNNNVSGINTFDSYIFATNHGFKSGEVVRYSYTESPISGLSSQISYYVDVIDTNKFKLASAGIGATLGNVNLINKRYEPLNTLGLGTHIIQYPPIVVSVETISAIGATVNVQPILKPVILGSVEDVFLEDGGVAFGCTNIVNFHRRPVATLPSIESEALLKPIIVNTSIVGIQIINKGRGYREDATINIESIGKFCELLPTIQNGSVVSVTVIRGGIGYATTNTTLKLENSGSGLKLLANVNEWKINQVVKLKNRTTDDDGLIYPSKNPELGLQFVNLYVPRTLRLQLGDNINQNLTEQSAQIHSPLLGYAYDGNPIYGPYAYSKSLGGSIERMTSGYVLDVNPNSNLRPPGFESGYFVDDYVFIGTGNLDEFNGRYCITPEFPNGIYAYFTTIIISTSGGGQNIPAGVAIPEYPYVIGPKFKDVPIINNFLPKFNQDLYNFNTTLSRNISPYYLNYYNSGYELINSVADDYKQEFRVESVKSDKIDKVSIFSPGENYAVNDVVVVDNEDTGGTSASISISRISGKTISNVEFVDELIPNIDFIVKSNKIVVDCSGPHGLGDGAAVRVLGISTVTSSYLEGIRYIKVKKKEVGLAKTVADVATTGASTKIVVSDVAGFEPNDFIGIGTEILHITKINKQESSFSVNRLSNTGIHSVGVDNVVLLPKKFEFISNKDPVDYVIGNTTVFFNPKEDVGTGSAGTSRLITGLTTSFYRTLPAKSIYFSEGHKFYTGQELIYNCGFGGTSLFVNNIGSGVSFKLENNQKVYAVNLGNNYLGLSTVGFTSTSGIGSQFNSLEFRDLNEFFGVIGVGHSLTTTNPKIIGNEKSIYLKFTTATNHGLTTGDHIKLNLDIVDEEVIKVIYDRVNRKVLVKEIAFTDSNVSSVNDTIDISSYTGEIKTGDKVVYIAETPISGLSHFGIYYVIKNSLNTIRLAQYLSDIYPITSFVTNDQGVPLIGLPNVPIKYINFGSTGGSVQKIYFVNPSINIFRGNKLKFDLSDASLSNMKLNFYSDSLLDKQIPVVGKSSTGFVITENGIPGDPGSYLKIDTALPGTPRTFYYNLTSTNLSELEKVQLSTDYEVVGNNHIELLSHSLNGTYKVEVLNNNVFAIENNKNLTYIESQAVAGAIKTYDTDSLTAVGPISKLKINFAGRGYKKPPLVKTIQSRRGNNAIVKIDSPNIGRIESFVKIKDGFDYPTDPTLSPQMSSPSVVSIKDIQSIKDISVIFGGRGYNNPPVLFVPENPNIKLEAQSFNSSAGIVESVRIVKNSTEMSKPLEIVTIRNSNGYDIDFITVNGELVTLELANSDFIPTTFGGNQSIFPFSIGDQVFLENCRLTPTTQGQANFNSSSYKYQFFPVVGVSTSNNTVTYSMSGISTGTLGTYDSNIPSGIVVNKKDMPIFRMNLIENVSYFSSEIVNSNKFQAKVLENGWDGKLNQLRVDSGAGELEIGSKLFGQESKTNGTIESFNTFIMNSTLGVSRDKVGNIDNSVGILNEFQQRISDNFYYQKFSYSIKGDIPYSSWKESVRSLIHPSGFKEFSDLVIYSEPQQTLYSENNLKPKILDSTSIINVSVDNEISMYDKTNFTKVYEEDSLPDGSIETIYINDGLILKPYINNKTNKVLKIDDISDQFNGRSFQSLGNRYADASDLLLYNRSFIREEVVGFVTATYPSILANVDWDRTITSEKFGSVIDSIAHDLKYESNNKSTEVGLSYWSGVGTSYVAGEVTETIAGLKYILELSKFIINNVGVQTSYNLSTSFSVSNLTYDNISGIATITTTAPHLLTNSDYVVLKNIVLSCNSGGGLSTAIFPSLGAGPDGNPSLSPKGFSYKVNVVGVNTFTVNPGISTIPHAYQSGGTVQKAFINVGQEFDLTITKDTSCSSTYNQNCCANQTSAISNLIGIVTSIVGIGTTTVPSNIILPSLTRGGSIVGLSTFKLKNKGKPLFKHIFESNASFIDVANNKFVITNHNYQSGQELIYQSTNSPIGIATTSYVTGITSSLVKVGNFEGTAILENGLTVAISTSITGISTTLVPAGPNFQQYSSVIGIGTLGTGAEFNVFLTYDTSTGVPIGTSIILNRGGTGYKIGDTVTIAGTYMGGTSPTNNLSFIVSKVTPTDVLAQSNITYSNVPSTDGSGATFNISRDIDGYVSSVDVVSGGVGYSSTSKVSIAGTYVGGTSQDIVTVSPTELGTNILPKVVYVIKLNDNEFRVSGFGTGGLIKLTGIGSGPHSLTYSNPDPSVLISIDGIVQSALRRKSLQVVLSQPVSTATTTLLSISSGISSLAIGDIININNELVVIKSVGIGSTNIIEVSREAFESISGVHTVGAACSVMSGDFKIIGDTIHFTAAPYGKVGLVGLETGSNFGGRVFSRKLDANNPIDQNIILDDISLSFTGLAATQFSLKSNGNAVTALYNNVNNSSFINNNPLILINNVLQESGVKYEIENNAQNQINFIDGPPKAGKIVKVGIMSGFGYQPLLVAAAEVTVSASGTISSVILTGKGGGYRQSPVISVASTIGFGASITATVGVSGTITGFTIVNAGTGYTSTSIPVVNIGIPTGYSNLPLTYYSPSTGVGQGAKVTVVVGSGSSIISFAMDQPGVAYKVGDVLTATGITTGPGLRTDILNITDFTYNNVSGISTITTDITHNLKIDDNIRISGAAFTCGYDEVGIQTFSYDNITGICTVVTYSPHGLLKTGVPSNQTSDEVFLFNLPFSCAAGYVGVTTTIFPDGTSPFGRVFPVLSSVGLNTFTINAGISTITHTFTGWPEIGISTFTYEEFTGISTATTSSDHGFEVGDKVTLSGLAFTCAAEYVGVTTTIFPDGTSPYGYTLTVTGVTTNTFTFNAGISTIVHNYVSGGITKKVPTSQRVLRFTDESTDNSYDFRVIGLGGTNQFTIVSSASTISHYYVQSGIVSFRSFEPFLLTVQEVETDKFAGFYPGQFILFASIADQFNGFKKRFTLKAIIEGVPQQISFRVPQGTDLDITNNIFIYLNDVLQIPGESYTFVGSRVIFTEAPKPNSFCSIFYYRGSSLDVEEVTPPQTIKIGDGVTIRENANDPLDSDQFERVVKLIPSSDEFATFTYDSLGISTNPLEVRPLTWSKQKHDRIINGVLFPKSRPSLKGLIRPQATLIKNISIDDASIYVDSAYPIFSDVDGLKENLRDIVVVENRDIEPATGLAIVSAASSISSITLVTPGSGYLNDTSPQLFVSSSAITQKDPIFNWKGVTGISPSYKLNSVTFGNVFVGVGSTQAVITSPDGKTWQNSTIGLATNFDAKSVIAHQITSTDYVYVSVGSSARVVRTIGAGNSIAAWSTIELKELSAVPGIGIIGTLNSSYVGTLKEVVYSPSYSTYVTVGTGGSIFTGVGVGTDYFVNKFSQTISSLNSVSFAFNSSINSGYFIAVGNNGTILTSTYGQIWNVESQFTVENLNKVIYAEGRFVIVGSQGTVIRSISQSQYEVIPTNIGVNLVNIKYAYGTYVASDDSQNIYYSLNLSHWVTRSTNQSNSVGDFIFTDTIGVDGTYVIVGHGGTAVYAEPVLNRATGNCLVSGGIATSIVVTNGGFGYSSLNQPSTIIKSDSYNIENIFSIKVIGDHGKIIGINTFVTGTPGIGTNTPKIEFVLKSETYDNQTLGIGYSSLNVFGVNNSQLIKGDYFVISDSNVVVGHAITGITTSLGGMTNYPASRVGTAVSFIDGVYRVEQVTTAVAGIVTVTCNLAPSSFGNYVQIYKRGASNTGINTNDFYGNYSWGKIYDFQNRSGGNPKTFTAFTDNGIAGLSTSAKIFRTKGLLSN
jgi:hypothetical protein